ncbi:MAG TPA: hypothetical protein DCZ72_02605 [Armatimonadetes bacterium]|nr:hypothetical protein [Armatimonadota bacterium]
MTALCLLASLLAQPAATAPAPAPFGLRIVDAETGRGVPLVELKATTQQRFWTDSAGWVAITEPELLGHEVFFHVASHGYEFEQEGFGYRGRAVRCEPGGRATWPITRRNLAERLYRITGAGIYNHSVTLGEPVPIAEPLLNGGVAGLDSTQPAVYQGRIHWFWGDTNRLAHPLGNFETTGGVSDLPAAGGLDPAVGIDIRFHTNDAGFARSMIRRPGPGPIWVDGMITLPDAAGRERLCCGWTKVDQDMRAVSRGLAAWDDAAEQFELVVDVPLDAPYVPYGQPFIHEGYAYFGDPFPNLRVPATFEAWADLDQYEGFAWGADGYQWRPGVAGDPQYTEHERIEAGEQPAETARWRVRAADEPARRISLHRGTVRYNPYLDAWLLIAVGNFGGPSFLGEVWAGIADSPMGPWGEVRRILTHDRYSFYNPRQDEFFDQDGGRTVYFEGTYASTFSRTEDLTPLYDYNQMMYRLDVELLR